MATPEQFQATYNDQLKDISDRLVENYRMVAETQADADLALFQRDNATNRERNQVEKSVADAIFRVGSTYKYLQPTTPTQPGGYWTGNTSEFVRAILRTAGNGLPNNRAMTADDALAKFPGEYYSGAPASIKEEIKKQFDIFKPFVLTRVDAEATRQNNYEVAYQFKQIQTNLESEAKNFLLQASLFGIPSPSFADLSAEAKASALKKPTAFTTQVVSTSVPAQMETFTPVIETKKKTNILPLVLAGLGAFLLFGGKK